MAFLDGVRGGEGTEFPQDGRTQEIIAAFFLRVPLSPQSLCPSLIPPPPPQLTWLEVVPGAASSCPPPSGQTDAQHGGLLI